MTGLRSAPRAGRVLAAGLLASGLVATPVAGWSHPGGLDAAGCHTNRKTGERHCHRAAAPARPDPFAGRSSDAFPNCAAARAAGAAPIRRGEPGYGPHLDRDNDEIACEPYRGR